MRFVLAILFVLLFCSKSAVAQVDQVYTGTPTQARDARHAPNYDAIKEKIFWGGNFQIWFGNPTFILLCPTIGYQLADKVQVGVGGIYNYSSYSGSYGNYSQSVFGVHTFGRYLVTESFYIQAQFDKLNQPDLFAIDPTLKRWVNYLFVGGGFKHAISGNAAFTTSIMYNLTPDPALYLS